jgi:hypothetical protein
VIVNLERSPLTPAMLPPLQVHSAQADSRLAVGARAAAFGVDSGSKDGTVDFLVGRNAHLELQR